ncbi:MAG: cation:proton antiporter, partial [Candidatus Heimdallarchaeota archaeon]|nr:cation:proton antiporter [Candidatus Heimdallarchaeota archaeon]
MSDINVGLIIVEIGSILVLGFAGAFLLKKIHVPQVLGFILTGFIIGLPNRYWQSFISESFLDSVTPTITTLALGFIGFNIGAELSWKELRKMDRKIILILLADSIGTFVIVTVLVGATGILSWNFAAILGALASATAPAATADVLWEYKASGPLTRAVLFILAVDDIIAIFLVQITTNITKGQIVGDISGWHILAEFGLEAGAALGIGLVFGFVITLLINRVKDHGEIMELTLGSLIVVFGLSILIGSSAILAAMIFGIIIVSVSKKSDKETQEVFHNIYKIGSPVVAVFFILVGFRMNPADLLLIG